MSERRKHVIGQIILAVAAFGMVFSLFEFLASNKAGAPNWFIFPSAPADALAWIFLALAVFAVVYARPWQPTSKIAGALLVVSGAAFVFAGPMFERSMFQCLPSTGGFLMCIPFSDPYSLGNDAAFLAWSSLALGTLLFVWGIAKGRLWEIARSKRSAAGT